MGRSLKLIAILAFASLALTACGKRGPLDTPGSRDEDGHKIKQEKKQEEYRPFVLDSLLR